jgi:hypothetical protein
MGIDTDISIGMVTLASALHPPQLLCESRSAQMANLDRTLI